MNPYRVIISMNLFAADVWKRPRNQKVWLAIIIIIAIVVESVLDLESAKSFLYGNLKVGLLCLTSAQLTTEGRLFLAVVQRVCMSLCNIIGQCVCLVTGRNWQQGSA